eukprot:snap_masked-scaffold_6-processed-gene-11.46-mRNA-1 protein AED:1.00 eAED:1.00 QI:0/0/0/0/1/1/3/0/334
MKEEKENAKLLFLREIDFFKKENYILEKAYERLVLKSQSDGRSLAASRSSRLVSSMKKPKQKKDLRLNLNEKSKILNDEHEILTKKNLDERQRFELDLLKKRALIELQDLKMKDIKREAFEFKREVVMGSKENKRVNTTKGEDKIIFTPKVVKYLEVTLKFQEALVKKLTARCETQKSILNKTKAQLKRKEDQAGSLQYIDFHTLHIKNKQLQEKINDKNKELVRLKNGTTMLSINLNATKEKVADETEKNEKIITSLESKAYENIKVRKKIENLENEIKKEEKSFKSLLRKQEENIGKNLTVGDYMAAKRRLEAEEKKMKNLERKIEIALIKC